MSTIKQILLGIILLVDLGVTIYALKLIIWNVIIKGER